MKTIRVVTLVLALAGIPAYAAAPPGDAIQTLIQEGAVLTAQGRLQDAMNKFSAAAKADPASSLPLSRISHVLFVASLSADGDNAARLRQQSEGAARQALTLDAKDPLAQEVLRRLADGKGVLLHETSMEVLAVVREGEVLYHGGKHDEARAKYEQAFALDPQYSSALVFIGDTYYVQQNMPQAEAYFRKATVLEPLNGQAWRFLSDALVRQGKRAAGEAALLNGIAAQPSQRPNWDKLANLRGASGFPLTPLQLKRKPGVAPEPGDRPFASELASWQAAIQAADDATDPGADPAHAGQGRPAGNGADAVAVQGILAPRVRGVEARTPGRHPQVHRYLRPAAVRLSSRSGSPTGPAGCASSRKRPCRSRPRSGSEW